MPNPFKNLFKGKDESEVKLDASRVESNSTPASGNQPPSKSGGTTSSDSPSAPTKVGQTAQDLSSDASSNAPQSGGVSPSDQTQTTIKTTQTTQTVDGPQPYSGIGPPPAPKTTTTTIKTEKKEQTLAPPEAEAKQQAPQPEEAAPKQPPQPEEDQAPQGKKLTSTAPGGTGAAPRAISGTGAIDRGKRSGIDVLTRLTARSNQAMMAGVNKAKELHVQYIDTEHALWGLLSDAGIYQLISELKVTPSQIQTDTEAVFKKGDFQSKPQFSPRVKRALELSLSVARSLGYEFISPEHILLALAQEGEGQASKILAKHGLTVEVLNKKITGKEKVDKEAEGKRSQSSLDRFTHDLTQMAREGKLDPVVSRSAEIERIMHILSRRTKNNPVLIGEAGVGKTAIVEGLAQRIAAGNVPETLQNKRVLSVDLMSIIAGASHRGEFEQRLKNLIREVKAAGGEIVLFIDEIHNMVGAGAGRSSGAMDASNILKPSLARGELQTIGATTTVEYRKHMEKDRALERRFQPVMVEEPTPEQAIEMLAALRDKYEAFHKVSIPDEAIKAAVFLSHRYIGDRFLPDKAVDLMDEAASSVRLPAISLPEEIKQLEERKARLLDEKKEARKGSDDVRIASVDRRLEKLETELKEKRSAYEFKKSTTTNQVTPEIIQEIVSRWTNIPVSRLTESESDKLLRLEELLHKRIIDQQYAIDAVAEAVRRGRAGLKSAKRPIGSFIFMGPTGVGKTELAKALAEILFGAEEKMVRLDMTEYMEKHEVAKLIGAPPGYVGYEEGGQLTEAVRRQPYSVILLDEIEKAHADVFNILLQILDDGRLTDNKGRTIDFKNTILVATSNIGTNLIQKEMVTKTDFVFEARALSTLVYSPTGRAIATLAKRMWQKEQEDKSWTTLPLKDYFKGQNVEGADMLDAKQKFPVGGFDSHVISPTGLELITAGGRVWRRKSTTAKTWRSLSLIDYFKDQEVTNAEADQPEQQLPTAKIDTVAISPSETQIMSFNGRFWMRNNLTANRWQTGTLKDYLEGSYVQVGGQKPEESTKESQKNSESSASQKAQPVSESENQKTSRSDNQTIRDTDQTDTQINRKSDTLSRSEFSEKSPSESSGDVKGVSPQVAAAMKPSAASQPTPPPHGPAEPDPDLEQKVKELMGETDQKSEDRKQKTEIGTQRTDDETETKRDESVLSHPSSENRHPSSVVRPPEGSAQEKLEQVAKISKKVKHQLPTNRWDIHLFTPAGEEIIIKNKRYWKRAKFDSKLWTTGVVRELFPTTHVKNADINDPEQQLPVGQEVDKARKAKQAAEEVKFTQLKDKLLDALREFFRPELLNRFDDIQVFKPLSPADLLKIVDLQFNDLAKLLEEQNIGLEVTDEAKQEIAVEGYDPIFGARPLRRTIQKMIENPISSMIIKGDLKPGDIIMVDFDGNDFIFTAKLHPSRVKRAEVKGLTPSDEVKGLALSGGTAYNFRCEDCQKTFTSEVVEQASILCPNCVSHNVNVVTPEEKEETTKPQAPQKPAPEAPSVPHKKTQPEGSAGIIAPPEPKPTPPSLEPPPPKPDQVRPAEGEQPQPPAAGVKSDLTDAAAETSATASAKQTPPSPEQTEPSAPRGTGQPTPAQTPWS